MTDESERAGCTCRLADAPAGRVNLSDTSCTMCVIGPVPTVTALAGGTGGRVGVPFSRATVAIAIYSAVALTLVACGGDGNDSDLSDPRSSSDGSTSATAAPSPTESTTSEEEAVFVAYEAFYAAVAQADANPPQADQILAPVATGLQYETTVSGIKGTALAGEEVFGMPILNPEVVSVDATTAVVHDCQDTSGIGRRVVATGEVLTVGRNPDSAETTLQMVDGAWKVATTEFVEPTDLYCAGVE